MSTKPQIDFSDEFSSEEQRTGSGGEGATSRPTVRAELSGRWQIPLLVTALVLLGLAVWRLRPQPKPPTFDELLAKAVALQKASKHEEASQYAEALLADPVRSAPEKARLHRLIAGIIFEHESENIIHGPTNCRRILSNLDQSLLEHEQFDGETHRIRALAREWLNQPNEAIAEYEQALAKGVEQPWSIRRHVLQLKRAGKSITDGPYLAALEPFIQEEDVPADARFWAAEQRISVLAEAGEHEAAERFLEVHRPQFESGEWRKEYDYLQALIWYHVGRFDDAERTLRVLRDQVVPGDQMYAQVGWLLGMILQQDGMPEPALSLFDEVIEKSVPSPSRTACVLGRAGCLAELEKYDQSIKALRDVIRIVSETPLESQVDLMQVRESATAWYQTLNMAGRQEAAMDYLKLAARLAPAADAKLQAQYAQRIADLAFALGTAAARRGDKKGAEAAADHEMVRKFLNESGEQYLRLASLTVLDVPTAMAAVWKAADAYDRAGERAKMVGVLEKFIQQYPDSTRVPEALRQLGMAHQIAGDLAKAVEHYQENLIKFPRTPAAVKSLIPLADCFAELKQADKAEQTLLRIVTPRPDDRLALITPEAEEYREALFRLGDLYLRSEQYEKAITRFEEIMERYAEDTRADLTTFQLADAYRHSAARIRKDLEDPQNIAQRDSLRASHQARLQRSREMFEKVIERYQKRPETSLNELDRVCFKVSHLYAADTVYDLSLIGEAGTTEPFARSLPMYEKAASVYKCEPIAMSAYVQIVNCYLRLGNVAEAWMALQRARWALRNIPDDAFLSYSPEQDRGYWENYLTWLEKKPMFASIAMAKAG